MYKAKSLNLIELFNRKKYGENLVRSPFYERCSSIADSQRLLDKRLGNVDTNMPPPKELMTNFVSRNTRAGFPLLDNVLLNQEPSLRFV